MKGPARIRRQRFVEEYLIDLNATQAAIRAGYSSNGANVQAVRMLADATVSAAVAKGRANLAAKAQVSAEEIVAELKKLGFSNMRDFVDVDKRGSPVLDFSELSREQWAAVGELTVEHCVRPADEEGEEAKVVEKVKFKLLDKRAALVDLGKHLGMFIDRVSSDVVIREAVDRPPGETREQWIERRRRELATTPVMGHADG